MSSTAAVRSRRYAAAMPAFGWHGGRIISPVLTRRWRRLLAMNTADVL
jgi:hypothetical protein